MDPENQSGTTAPVQGNTAEAVSTPAETTGRITPELAASLPLTEVKRRLYAEAEETAATPTAPADTRGEETPEGAVTPEEAGAERDERGRFTGQQTSPEQQQATTEAGQQRRKNYATVEEAVRDLDAVRGNLTQYQNTAAEERRRLQSRVQELEAEAARQRQQSEQAAAQAQHERFEQLVAQLPTQAQRDQARLEYQQVLARQAFGEYQQHLATQEQTLQQREFAIAKAQLPGIYQDIARFVADNNGVPHEEMLALVNDQRIGNLIQAAQTPEAVQSVSIALGELLDFEASRLAAQRAGVLEARRESKSAGRVPDVPPGVQPNGGAEAMVDRIKRMTPQEFQQFKRERLRAAE